MLNRTIVYHFMTNKQLGKCVNKIKMKIDKEDNFDKRLKLLEDLAVIVGVLLRRCRHDVKVVNYTMSKLNDLEALIK